MASRLLMVLLTGACVIASACSSNSSSDGAVQTEAQATGSNLTDIKSVLALRAAFNEDRGTPRLLLLLSPT